MQNKYSRNSIDQIMKIRRVLTVLFGILMLTQNVLAQDEDVYVEELRGVWITNVDSDVLNSKQNIAEGMDFLAERGFNIIYPVVWNKGYTLFPSEVAEDSIGYLQDPVFANQGRDPLQEIIVEAHRNGMEVIPWFEYGFASVYGDPSGGHIIEKNPHWAAIDADGNIANRNGFYWMNAIHPFVQEFMLGIMEEAIENYDIDGVQGDDRLPAMSSTAGYSEYTKQLYRDEHDGEDPPASYDDASFLKWKADKLTTFAGDLYSMVKSKDSLLTLSLSPSIYSFSYDNYLQDWPTWLDSNYVDIIHPQAYRYDIGGYRTVIRNMLGQQPYSSQGYIHRYFRPQIFPGILIKAGGAYNDAEYVLNAIEFNRSYDLKGEVYFFYEGLDEKNNYLADTLYKYKYGTPAILPNRHGKVRRPKGIITNESTDSVTVTGSWSESEKEGYLGKTLVADANTESVITYDLEVPYDAWYRIYAWVPTDTEATQDANYEVFGVNDTSIITVDQTVSTNRGWVEIGNRYLEKGKQTVVKIDADKVTDGKPTYADAVMLLLDRKKSPNVEIEVVITSMEGPENDIPSGYKLQQNYPNPFNPTTEIGFKLPTSTKVTLEVFDILGRRVALIEDQKVFSAGSHQITFDAKALSSGLYIYRLRTGNVTMSKKMILVK